MFDWKTTPPDFSTWPPARRDSVFRAIGVDQFRHLPFQKGHEGRANWLGYIDIYEDGKGVLAGQEFAFFGRHRILKFWGLKGEPHYAFFAVYAEQRWKSFARKEYEPAISAIAPRPDPALIIGARVLVKELAQSKKVIMEATVWRADTMQARP